jgi:hypothetical protein
MSAAGGKIEIVRGRLSEERSGQVLAFWERESRLDAAEARRRLGEIVCIAVDDGGEVIGVNSVYDAAVDLLAGHRMWVYRNLLTEAAADMWAPMINTAWKALDAEFRPEVPGPLGLAVPVGDPDRLARMPDADSLWPKLVYAGRMGDAQLRIRYFGGARLGEPRPIDDYAFALEDRGHRIHVFAEQDAITADDVVELWTREGAMAPDEARRRVGEVLLVATDAAGEPVGVATAYLERNAQLGLDLWYFRAFVTAEHRATKVGASLLLVARDHLQARFVAAQDQRGAGVVLEVENEMLKRYFDYAWWSGSDFTFIGHNERGNHVRVHFFPGAAAP